MIYSYLNKTTLTFKKKTLQNIYPLLVENIQLCSPNGSKEYGNDICTFRKDGLIRDSKTGRILLRVKT